MSNRWVRPNDWTPLSLLGHSIAASLRRRQPILLRVNASFEVHDADAAVQLGGGAQKFGVDEEQLDDVLPQILKLRHLDLQGVHVFAATGVLESTLLVEYTRHVFDLVQRLERDYRRRFPVVDLGGGLGVDYRAFPGRDLDLAHYAASLRGLIATFGFGDKEIALELGRYLVGEAGTYVVRVLDVKHSRGTDYALVDGGTNHFRRPVAVRQDHPVTLLLPATGSESGTGAVVEDYRGSPRTYAIGGPLCTSIDVIARAALLPAPARGRLARLAQSRCLRADDVVAGLPQPCVAGRVPAGDGRHGDADPRTARPDGPVRRPAPPLGARSAGRQPTRAVPGAGDGRPALPESRFRAPRPRVLPE